MRKKTPKHVLLTLKGVAKEEVQEALDFQKTILHSSLYLFVKKQKKKKSNEIANFSKSLKFNFKSFEIRDVSSLFCS